MNIKSSLYRCDSTFYLNDIIQMYTDDHTVDGIVYTDGASCTWYTLVNTDLKKITCDNIHLQNQFKNGGFSSNRLARNRDIQRDHYLTELAEKTVNIYYDKQNNKQKVTNIVFCGPAEFKKELSDHKLINTYFKHVHIITMSELNYQLIIDTITNYDDPTEIDTVEQIRNMIRVADDKLVFGDELSLMIRMRLLSTLYVHHEIQIDKLRTELDIDYDIEIVKIKSNMIKDYGCVIGIKFY